MSDETPPCTLQLGTDGPSGCYCTGRPGCPSTSDDVDGCEYCGDPVCAGDCDGNPEWADDDTDDGEPYRPIVTIDTGGLL